MFPSQKWNAVRRVLRFVRGFNEAGMFPSQKSGRGAQRGHRCYCFNEAGMFPSQKWWDRVREWAALKASMRPGCFHPRNKHRGFMGVPSTMASMRPGCFHPRNTLETGLQCRFIRYRFNEAGMFPSQK